jgi:hypothetical protein
MGGMTGGEGELLLDSFPWHIEGDLTKEFKERR